MHPSCPCSSSFGLLCPSAAFCCRRHGFHNNGCIIAKNLRKSWLGIHHQMRKSQRIATWNPSHMLQCSCKNSLGRCHTQSKSPTLTSRMFWAQRNFTQACNLACNWWSPSSRTSWSGHRVADLSHATFGNGSREENSRAMPTVTPRLDPRDNTQASLWSPHTQKNILCLSTALGGHSPQPPNTRQSRFVRS